MAYAKIEQLTGSVNGTNVQFDTTYEYRPGSVRVFVNGVVNRQIDDDGWVEVGFKRIRLNEPPRVGEVVSAYYVIV